LDELDTEYKVCVGSKEKTEADLENCKMDLAEAQQIAHEAMKQQRAALAQQQAQEQQAQEQQAQEQQAHEQQQAHELQQAHKQQQAQEQEQVQEQQQAHGQQPAQVFDLEKTVLEHDVLFRKGQRRPTEALGVSMGPHLSYQLSCCLLFCDDCVYMLIPLLPLRCCVVSFT